MVNLTSDNTPKKRGQSRRQETVHAQYAVWTRVVNPEGKTIGYDGRFDKEDHVLGAVSHLWNSGILSRRKWHHEKPRPNALREREHYIMSLRAAEDSSLSGDNLEKFEKFADAHGLLDGALTKTETPPRRLPVLSKPKAPPRPELDTSL